MPTYVYETIPEVGEPSDSVETFEVEQRMSEAPLTTHPETGVPVRRILSVPFIGGKWSESRNGTVLSDKNVAAKGFTKYVNAGNGRYDKVAGDGPKTIHR